MNLAVAYNLTMIIVVTHIDIAKEEMVRETCSSIRNCLKELCPDKTPTVVKKLEDAVFMSQIVSNEAVIPIFPISNVTGENLDVMISFLNQLPPLSDLSNNVAMPTEFLISERFVVKNKTILAGTVIKGHINKGQHLYLGPDSKGNFRSIEIVDIRCLMVNVRYAKCGQTCTVYIVDPND
jgi:GTPase